MNWAVGPSALSLNLDPVAELLPYFVDRALLHSRTRRGSKCPKSAMVQAFGCRALLELTSLYCAYGGKVEELCLMINTRPFGRNAILRQCQLCSTNQNWARRSGDRLQCSSCGSSSTADGVLSEESRKLIKMEGKDNKVVERSPGTGLCWVDRGSVYYFA